MTNEKALQRDNLIMEFGELMQPLASLTKRAKDPSEHELRRAIVQIQGGEGHWRNRAKAYATFADDIEYRDEGNELAHVPENCIRQLKHRCIEVPDREMSIRDCMDQCLEIAKRDLRHWIDLIPINWEPELLAANTPFTSYLKVRAATAEVTRRLHYFDRYLKPVFFQLFLPAIARDIEIRLVTTAGNDRYGVKRVAEISKLASTEFENYRLIEISRKHVHDRNLRVDDQIFWLGEGVDRAGLALTNFGPADSSPEAHREFDKIIEGGKRVH